MRDYKPKPPDYRNRISLEVGKLYVVTASRKTHVGGHFRRGIYVSKSNEEGSALYLLGAEKIVMWLGNNDEGTAYNRLLWGTQAYYICLKSQNPGLALMELQYKLRLLTPETYDLWIAN